MGTGISFTGGVEESVREADHWPSTEEKKAWSYALLPHMSSTRGA
jgi:hypothetical protein